jgi:hypothetical protein
MPKTSRLMLVLGEEWVLGRAAALPKPISPLCLFHHRAYAIMRRRDFLFWMYRLLLIAVSP